MVARDCIQKHPRAVRARSQNTLRIGRGDTRASLTDTDWWADAWGDAVAIATAETGLDTFPDACPWDLTEIQDLNWLPG
jgi:hypothetical protein